MRNEDCKIWAAFNKPRRSLSFANKSKLYVQLRQFSAEVSKSANYSQDVFWRAAGANKILVCLVVTKIWRFILG